MKFDPVKTRTLLNTAEQHFIRPGGELIRLLHEQLSLALEEFGGFDSEITAAKSRASAAELAAKMDKKQVVDLTAEVNKLITAVETLKVIAADGRNAKSKAQQALADLAPAPQQEAQSPAPAVPAQ